MQQIISRQERKNAKKTMWNAPATKIKKKIEKVHINTTSLDDNYDPSKIESEIYQTWLSSGYFSSEYNSTRREVPEKCESIFSSSTRETSPQSNNTFMMMIPPANITGSLHIG